MQICQGNTELLPYLLLWLVSSHRQIRNRDVHKETPLIQCYKITFLPNVRLKKIPTYNSITFDTIVCNYLYWSVTNYQPFVKKFASLTLFFASMTAAIAVEILLKR